MKNLKNKKATSILAILLMLSFTTSILAIPNTNAQHDKSISEMTISIPDTITEGSPVIISGTVMDISPGILESESIKLRFPNGVPVVSDKNIDQWMLYVYKQYERPTDVTGVEVTIFAYQKDNDKVVDIGTTTSDANGRFSITWTPPTGTAGDYEVNAYFSGSEGYYGSYAQTAITIAAAPSYSWYVVGTMIAIIIILSSMALIFVKRKHK